MSPNPTTVNVKWQKFRDQLFALIESRRAIASTFKYSTFFFFINNCSAVFNSPGTDKARQALAWIADNGSFRLVADSLGNFQAMFPAAERPVHKANQVQQGYQPAEVLDHAKVVPIASKEGASEVGSGRRPREDSDGRHFANQPSTPPPDRGAPEPETKLVRLLARARVARPLSGRPF